jgi:hypothetical protein
MKTERSQEISKCDLSVQRKLGNCKTTKPTGVLADHPYSSESPWGQAHCLEARAICDPRRPDEPLQN